MQIIKFLIILAVYIVISVQQTLAAEGCGAVTASNKLAVGTQAGSEQSNPLINFSVRNNPSSSGVMAQETGLVRALKGFLSKYSGVRVDPHHFLGNIDSRWRDMVRRVNTSGQAFDYDGSEYRFRVITDRQAEDIDEGSEWISLDDVKTRRAYTGDATLAPVFSKTDDGEYYVTIGDLLNFRNSWEGWSLGDHTLMVLSRALRLFDPMVAKGSLKNLVATNGENRILNFLLVVGLLHDIGKPLSLAAGNKRLQHAFSGAIIEAVSSQFSLSPFETKLAKIMVNHDVYGELLIGQEVWGDGAQDSDFQKGLSDLRRFYNKLHVDDSNYALEGQWDGFGFEEFLSLTRLYFYADASVYGTMRPYMIGHYNPDSVITNTGSRHYRIGPAAQVGELVLKGMKLQFDGQSQLDWFQLFASNKVKLNAKLAEGNIAKMNPSEVESAVGIKKKDGKFVININEVKTHLMDQRKLSVLSQETLMVWFRSGLLNIPELIRVGVLDSDMFEVRDGFIQNFNWPLEPDWAVHRQTVLELGLSPLIYPGRSSGALNLLGELLPQ